MFYGLLALGAALGTAGGGADPRVDEILQLIPAQASESNQLADKNFTNSSIATSTAYLITKTDAQGNRIPFDSVAELEAYTGTVTNNDYAYVKTTDASGNAYYVKYKYTKRPEDETGSWGIEYPLNLIFTAEQWAAITSGITSGKVALIDTALQPSDIVDMATKTWIRNEGFIKKPAYPLSNSVNAWNIEVRMDSTTPSVVLPLPTGNISEEIRYIFIAATANASFTAPTGYIVGDDDGYSGLTTGNTLSYTDLTVGSIYECSFVVIDNTHIALIKKEWKVA